jgi:hypothetical protein
MTFNKTQKLENDFTGHVILLRNEGISAGLLMQIELARQAANLQSVLH